LFSKLFSENIVFENLLFETFFQKNIFIEKHFPEKNLRNFFLSTLVEVSLSGLKLEDNEIFLLQWIKVS